MKGRDYFARPKPRLFGHRGAAGLAPENTMPSFRKALEQGAGYLELDVHATRDGIVVVIHDDTLERTTDGAGAVREQTFDELRRCDAGYRFELEGAYPYRGSGVTVPTLEEVVDAFPGVPLNIEIKQTDPPIEPEVVALLRRRGALERTMLAAEHHSIMERIRAAAPDAATSSSYEDGRVFFERCFAGALEGWAPAGLALQVPPRVNEIELVTAETVAAAHRVGLEVHVWTINEPEEMKRLLGLGVDGVMSDYPGLLVETAAKL